MMAFMCASVSGTNFATKPCLGTKYFVFALFVYEYSFKNYHRWTSYM